MRIKRTNTDEASSPHSCVYDGKRKSIYYVDSGADTTEPCLFRYNVIKKRSYAAYIKGPSLGTPGFIIPNSDGKTFTCGFNKFVGIVKWNGKKRSARLVKKLYSADPTLGPRLGPNERIYIGRRDPTGSVVYAGTVDGAYCGVPANQSVYAKRRGSNQERVLTDLTAPLGLASANGCTYVMDTCQLKLWAIPDPDSNCKNSQCGINLLTYSIVIELIWIMFNNFRWLVLFQIPNVW